MLGKRIANLRRRVGLSQAELAGRLHISPSAVGMYEQGRREPPRDVLVNMAREFGVTVDYLFTGRELGGVQGEGASYGSFLTSLGILTRDELIVLLTARLLGESPDGW